MVLSPQTENVATRPKNICPHNFCSPSSLGGILSKGWQDYVQKEIKYTVYTTVKHLVANLFIKINLNFSLCRVTISPRDGCQVKNETYSVGQKWNDGCDYTCTCSLKLEILCEVRNYFFITRNPRNLGVQTCGALNSLYT